MNVNKRTQKLTDALIADRNRDDNAARHNIVPCRSCGHTFLYKGRRGDLNGNFCSLRCQDWYDAGNAPIEHDHAEKAYKTPIDKWRIVAGPPDVEVGAPYYASVFPRGYRFTSMTMTDRGYLIRCTHCRKEFESLGLRCCSAECERSFSEAQHNQAVMAEVGIAPAPKRQCASCGARIPTWRKGRRVSGATRFCSPRCQQKALRQSNAKKAVLNGQTAKKAA